MQAIQAFIETQGGPEVIEWRKVALGAPGRGQALVRQSAIGLNYIDIYHQGNRFRLTRGLE
ncbi:hypothetical protein [Sphingopyxis sp. 113P3]|uniref:hypothetical protein n=1 Tax=Sphingopyxis sp. (strain 113P3) TaxID=292913 RepID=UPI0006AD21DA|nr:hypothetical protein [Sphingopyxis sp. 113P3]ALC13336.1 hypothetical protein LH20_15370 [Sphingopyxis sp. 113P3]